MQMLMFESVLMTKETEEDLRAGVGLGQFDQETERGYSYTNVPEKEQIIRSK